MRLCRFTRADRSCGWGLLTTSGVQDISIADPTLPIDTCEVIENWGQYATRVQYLSKRLGLSDQSLRLLPPLAKPSKVLCIGLNYRDHARETNAPIPEEPIVFCKMPTAIIGPDDPIVLPAVSTQVDFEAELVIVIGSRIRAVDEAAASDAIWGYTVGHDVSARDWQKNKPGKQWFLGKSFDTFAPLGPAIVTADEVPDPADLRIRCSINGEIMQDGSTADMIFKPAELVAYLSQVMTLLPGDVIFTGTPAGVGMARTPPRFLKPNDVVEIEIDGIGRLSNPCIAS